MLPLCLSIVGVEASWSQSASDYRQAGLEYRQQGDLDGAIVQFREAVALDPQNLSGRVLLGWTLHLHEQRLEAMQILRDTVWLNPASPPTLNALGIVYLVEGHLWPAVLTHSWAALIKPDNEIAFYNLSLAFQRLQTHAWAIAAAQQAIELEPWNPHPHLALAIIYQAIGDQSAAAVAYRDALNLDGRYGDVQFLEYLTEAGFSREQVAQTQELLQTVI